MKDNYGREVEELWFCYVNGTDGVYRCAPGQKMILPNEFHGQYDEDWVCIYEGDKEIMRYNTKFIATIKWK